MKNLLVYYWWNTEISRVWRDRENPVILSIATFRANDPHTPIHVIDASVAEKNWGHYPEKLNFQVFPATFSYPEPFRHEFGKNIHIWFHQTWDVYQHSLSQNADTVIFCDTDIFWRKSLFPLDVENVDGFVCSRRNTGLYYFNPCSSKTTRFYEIWKEYIIKGMTDEGLRKEVEKNYLFPAFNEESVWRYIYNNIEEVKAITKLGTRNENYFLYSKDETPSEKAKNFHCVRFYCGKNRYMYAYAVDDFYNNLCKILNKEEIDDIFDRPAIAAGSIPFKKISSMFRVNKVKEYFF